MKDLFVFWRRPAFVAIGILLFGYAAFFFLFQPCVFVESENQLLTWFVVSPQKDAFSLRFTHSVEKTPVVEKYRVDENNQLQLYATEYQSFGVGLPFLASEGSLTAKDGRFILQMNRLFPSISLRTGPEAQLTLMATHQYSLYQMLPPGSLVRIFAGTWFARLFDVSL